jgi:hypothetical protein
MSEQPSFGTAAALHHTVNATMLSDEAIEVYRKMTPGERLEVTLRMMRENMPYFFEGPEEVVRRRLELLERENNARNENMLRAIARTKRVE